VKKFLAVAAVAALALVMASCAGEGDLPRKASLDTFEERASYALGLDVASSLTRSGAEVDIAAFVQGFRDTLEGQTVLMNQEEMRTVLTEFSEQMRTMAQEKMESEGATNLEGAMAFMEENKAKEGVVTTESGLQYTVLTEGSGPKPGPTTKVKVHYTGTLVDGTQFDSSHDRGQPAEFPLNGVIPGWGEGLQLMSVGSTYRLFVPPDLGYGQRGAPPVIPPNAALIFDIELLGIVE